MRRVSVLISASASVSVNRAFSARAGVGAETTARFCVESRRFPDELVPEVVELRRLFTETVELFDKETNPLLKRAAGGPVGFGRKVNNQGFGRI